MNNISIIIRLVERNEDVDVELPLEATATDIIETLKENDLLTKLINYYLVSKGKGKAIKANETIGEANVQNGDILLAVKTEESEWILKYKDKMSDIPFEIIQRGPAYVEEYFKRLEGGSIYDKSQPLNECKLIFIGAGAVGKTSLIKRIVKNQFSLNEQKTEGIEITKWSYLQENKNTIKLNIWDFGGQEIMHSTHKFFMTRRSIYVLVINPRSQDQFTGEIELNYWLKLISSFGGFSPIVIAINKCEIHKMDLAKGALTDRFPQIVGFIETSCKDNKGITELKGLINQGISKLNHLTDVIPLDYLRIKQELENTNKDYLHYYEYENLCRNISPAFSANESEILIGLLNDLGVMLNISGNRRLANTQVLNPTWITNGVYSIINSPTLIENKGVVNEKDISRILDKSLYPTFREQGFIMDMMDHFELCYQIPAKKEHYFIPGAFPKDKPSNFRWDYENYLHFILKFDVLPSSVFSKFIVKKHSYIHDEIYWRHGVLLYEMGCNAIVEAHPLERKISIKISGDSDKRALLSSIRKEFREIFKSISKLKVESFLSLTEKEDSLINYHDLLSYEEAGIETYFEPKKKKKYSVRELLNGIEERIDLNDLKMEISDGKIDEVLKDLKSIFSHNNEILVLAARFNRMKTEFFLGTLEREKFLLEENVIISSTLKFIDNYQKEYGSQQRLKRQ